MREPLPCIGNRHRIAALRLSDCLGGFRDCHPRRRLELRRIKRCGIILAADIGSQVMRCNRLLDVVAVAVGILVLFLLEIHMDGIALLHISVGNGALDQFIGDRELILALAVVIHQKPCGIRVQRLDGKHLAAAADRHADIRCRADHNRRIRHIIFAVIQRPGACHQRKACRCRDHAPHGTADLRTGLLLQ